ncbi:hypothetical protein ACP4OV_016763 [Aristida adscensionis]
MASIPMKQLDGHGGYLRWKESLLLRLHTAGVARVLSEDPLAPADVDEASASAAASKKWARDDAVCRGHILAALSDRLLPDYARHATAAALWRALARTYDVAEAPRVWRERLDGLEFDHGGPLLLLEQIVHAEALGVAGKLGDESLADALCGKLPEMVATPVILRSGPGGEMGMELVWDVARRIAAAGVKPESLWEAEAAMARDQDGSNFHGLKRGSRTRWCSGIAPLRSARHVSR